MRRTLLLLYGWFGGAAAYGQLLSYGVEGGVPVTNLIKIFGYPDVASSITNRYIVGPTVELRLPFGLAVEADALYRHFSYRSIAAVGVIGFKTLTTTSGNWEFPILLKKRFTYGPIHPFVDAGVSFDKIAGLSQTGVIQFLPGYPYPTTTSTSHPAELKSDFAAGVAVGLGFDVKLLLLRISPEIRYTRWGTQQFNGYLPAFTIKPVSAGDLTSIQNQVEFLVGFTF